MRVRGGYRGNTSLFTPIASTVFALAIGGVLVSVTLQFRDDLRIQHGAHATATAESARVETTSDDHGKSYDTYVRVHFLTAQERRVRTTVHVTGKHEYAEGQALDLRYDAAHPRNAQLAGKPAVGWTGELLATLFFLGLVVHTVVAWRARARALRAEGTPATGAATSS